jgi:hypothetical protein
MRTLLAAAVVLLAAMMQTPRELELAMATARADVVRQVPADQQPPIIARLDRAAASLSAGRAYLALYLLESPFESSSAFGFARAAGVSTPQAFLDTWTRTGVPIATRPPAGARPAIVDAIAAAAEGRAAATYQASRPYAEDSGVDAGLYYLGESRALVAFAAFARTIAWPAPPTPPSFRSIATELAAFDAEMTVRYESMARSEHPTYISASAALKQARTLNDGGHYDAALFEYLLSRYLFAPLRGPAAQEATAARIAEARRSLGSSVDHSIAEVFLQLADEGVSGNVPAQRRGAAAALDEVLPAYFAAVAPPQAVTTAAATAPAAQVTITLVRWPFT